MKNEKVVLSGCYHTGLAYSLGYYAKDANEDVELVGETFTNLDIGLNGGAMAALQTHRKQFDPNCDVERFIVALKPVKIILGREDDEDYELSDNAGCDACGTKNRVDDKTRCDDCCYNTECDDTPDYDACGDCGEWAEDCTCDNDELYDYVDECCEKFVADTFEPMNAFARARLLKLQGKL